MTLRLVSEPRRSRRVTPAPVMSSRLRGAGGAFVPVASWITVQAMLRGEAWSLRVCILVAAMLGGLVFSAGTVYEYSCKAFRGRKAKAAAFVVLVEVLMTFSPLWWLSVAALVILAAINGIQTTRTMA